MNWPTTQVVDATLTLPTLLSKQTDFGAFNSPYRKTKVR